MNSRIYNQFLYEMRTYKGQFSTWELESLAYKCKIYTLLFDGCQYLTEKTKKYACGLLTGRPAVLSEAFLQYRGFGRSKPEMFDDE